jgi:hypothetical protein
MDLTHQGLQGVGDPEGVGARLAGDLDVALVLAEDPSQRLGVVVDRGDLPRPFGLG